MLDSALCPRFMSVMGCRWTWHPQVNSRRSTLVCVVQPTVKLLINGEFRESEATDWVDVTNPVRKQESSLCCHVHVPLRTPHQFRQAWKGL